MTWFTINYYPLNVLPGLPHVELWLSAGLWGCLGLVQGHGFSKPALPSARPAALAAPLSPADVVCSWDGGGTATVPRPGVHHQLHAYGFRDCYRSLITYVEADTQLINALLCGQYCLMLFVHREEFAY